MKDQIKHEDRTPENGWIDGTTADLGKRAEFKASGTALAPIMHTYSKEWRATRNPRTGEHDPEKDAVLRRYVDGGLSWEAAQQPTES